MDTRHQNSPRKRRVHTGARGDSVTVKNGLPCCGISASSPNGGRGKNNALPLFQQRAGLQGINLTQNERTKINDDEGIALSVC